MLLILFFKNCWSTIKLNKWVQTRSPIHGSLDIEAKWLTIGLLGECRRLQGICRKECALAGLGWLVNGSNTKHGTCKVVGFECHMELKKHQMLQVGSQRKQVTCEHRVGKKSMGPRHLNEHWVFWFGQSVLKACEKEFCRDQIKWVVCMLKESARHWLATHRF